MIKKKSFKGTKFFIRRIIKIITRGRSSGGRGGGNRGRGRVRSGRGGVVVSFGG